MDIEVFMLDYKKMLWVAFISVMIVIVVALLPACQKTVCVRDKMKFIKGCNRGGYCLVELENGMKGWSDDKVEGDHATICKKEAL